MNKETFIKELNNLNIRLTDKQLEELEIYASFLQEYNEHTNLTAITEINDIYLKHFYDSLTIVKAINLNDIQSLVDVGTGAGFPGMVLKIVYPHLQVTLLDSNNKKITFLNELIKKLNLDGIKTVNARSEEFALSNIDSFDLVTARAVSALRIIAELCLPMVKVAGYFIPLKGNATEEIQEAKEIITKLNGQLEEIINFTLPEDAGTRTLIKIKKINSNPQGFPRSYDKIKKSLKKNKK